MAAYSSDLRERVFQAYQSGLSSPLVAERFGVSAAFVRKLALLHRRYGTIEPRPRTQGRKPVLNDKQRDRLIELAGHEPDLTLDEMKARLQLRCCQTTVWRELKKAGLSFKRSLSKLASSPAKMSRKNARVGPAA
ncbi:helix-turn-helix domain-containing protein [Botrimarina hoheduenensis]|uniref:Transposase n=1 Tax=Botrimarina hoheduenensis TaxID=2528000 RepID=A0A5C5VPZ3_9BACT|nr:transposase [Botrimarina hoheduenensis]TWT40217.1 hypothetical protein Pla111_33480 [Botrimarina hoheduenensis]